MSAAAQSPKRFLLAKNGDILNVDYVVRVYADGAGKLFADMNTGVDIELAGNVSDMVNLRHMLPLNAAVP